MIEGILIGFKNSFIIKKYINGNDGMFFGTIIGMLPGLGPMTAIALNDSNYLWI